MKEYNIRHHYKKYKERYTDLASEFRKINSFASKHFDMSTNYNFRSNYSKWISFL